MATKRKAAEAFLEETKSSIANAHGAPSLATLLSITEAVGADPLGAGKPLLPVHVNIEKAGGVDVHRLPLLWRPTDQRYKPYAAASKLVTEVLGSSGPNNSQLEKLVENQIKDTLERNPIRSATAAAPRTMQLRVVLSPHLTLLDTVVWHNSSLSPETYAARVAADLALPGRCVQRIAAALNDALHGATETKYDPSFPKGPELLRTPRPQPVSPPAVHIQAPAPQDSRPTSKLGHHAGGAPSKTAPTTTAAAGPVLVQEQDADASGEVRGAWADAGSQPERPQSQAGTAPIGAAPVPAKADEAQAAPQPTAAGMGLGISFKIGLGGAASAGIKSKASAQLFAAQEDEDDDES